jgi:hypothetical protein
LWWIKLVKGLVQQQVVHGEAGKDEKQSKNKIECLSKVCFFSGENFRLLEVKCILGGFDDRNCWI